MKILRRGFYAVCSDTFTAWKDVFRSTCETYSAKLFSYCHPVTTGLSLQLLVRRHLGATLVNCADL
jgi:hypothetical protein